MPNVQHSPPEASSPLAKKITIQHSGFKAPGSVLNHDRQPPTSGLRPSPLQPVPEFSTSEATFNLQSALQPAALAPGSNLQQLRTRNLEPRTDNVHIIIGFAYPDAVAMVPVCQNLNVDFSVFVLGSDFRVRLKQPKFKNGVLEALRQTPHIFCPGQALKNDMIAAGLNRDQIHHFNNGVDADIFHP